jgi:hypothetical protein
MSSQIVNRSSQLGILGIWQNARQLNPLQPSNMGFSVYLLSSLDEGKGLSPEFYA